MYFVVAVISGAVVLKIIFKKITNCAIFFLKEIQTIHIKL
jgi:hypothetical protein